MREEFRGHEELGVVFDARAAQLTGFSATVFLTNLFLLPPDFESFLALPHETFDTAEELARRVVTDGFVPVRPARGLHMP